MSQEEWLAFHANPTVDALNRELVTAKCKPIDDCWCTRVTDVLINHVAAGKELDFLVRFKELGMRTTTTFILDVCNQFGYEHCVQYIDAAGCVPDEALILYVLFRFGPYDEYEYGEISYDGDEDDWEYTEKEQNVVIELMDRYLSVEPWEDVNKLPEFLREFLSNRASAASGTFATLYALKGIVGRDASQIIARVVWSERRNYFLSNRPNKK